jgi:hypothetical protein
MAKTNGFAVIAHICWYLLMPSSKIHSSNTDKYSVSFKTGKKHQALLRHVLFEANELNIQN